jgi:hypothetical protein
VRARVRVLDDYWLWRADLDFYYLDRGRSQTPFDAGVVDGLVLQIGWDNDRIVVERKPGTGGGPPDWVLIEVSTHSLSTPLSAEEWKRARAEREDLRSIRVRPVADAWVELGGK